MISTCGHKLEGCTTTVERIIYSSSHILRFIQVEYRNGGKYDDYDDYDECKEGVG